MPDEEIDAMIEDRNRLRAIEAAAREALAKRVHGCLCTACRALDVLEAALSAPAPKGE